MAEDRQAGGFETPGGLGVGLAPRPSGGEKRKPGAELARKGVDEPPRLLHIPRPAAQMATITALSVSCHTRLGSVNLTEAR
jgi:hypothetical protein